MIFDVLCLLLLGLAIFNGLRNGLIAALCSFAGVLLGIVIAKHFSTMLGSWFKSHYHYEGKWVSIGSFIILLIGTILLMKLLGKVIEKAMDLALLGWANRIGGIIFYVLLYAAVLIVLVHYSLTEWPELNQYFKDSTCFDYALKIADAFSINNLFF